MRWHTFLEALPGPAQTELVDPLALGCGRLAWAARLTAQNAPADIVAESLHIAQRFLIRGSQLLSPTPPSGDDTDTHTEIASPSPWHNVLAPEAPADARRVIAWLDVAVTHARAATTAILVDDDVQSVRLHLIGAISTMGDVRHLITSVPR